MKKPAKSMISKSIKIGIVLDTSLDAPDGVQQYVLSMSEWLQRAGHDVHYLVGETKRTDLPNLHSLSRNFTVKFNGNSMTIPLWANRKAAKALLQHERFDILHVQTPHHPLMAQYIIRSVSDSTAVVGTFHILPYNRLATVAARFLGVILRPSLKRIDTMLAVSSSAAVFEKKSFGLQAQVSPNVFDYSRFADASPLEKYQDDKLTILFLGRLVERKGCQHLMAAVAALDRTTLPSFRVVVCGKGELMAKLKQFVKDNDLRDIVEFSGYVSEEEKPRYYASADLAVFPSTSGESFGIVLLEAMASGNSAVLAGNNPGYATVMDPHPSLLFDPANTDTLAILIREYLTDATKRKSVAQWGKSYVKEFDVEVVGPQLVEIYQDAIAKRRANQHNKD